VASSAARPPRTIPNWWPSVVSLGAPFRGIRSHPVVLRTRDVLRGSCRGFLPPVSAPGCYTGHCTCNFVEALDRFPSDVRELAILLARDGVVDWRMCVTGDPGRTRGARHPRRPRLNRSCYRLLAEFLVAPVQ